jgi:hypothetical protein
VGQARIKQLTEERHRMRGTCQTCTHYSALHGECRESPIKGSLIGVDPKTGQPHTVGWFPPTVPDAWCGKYARDPDLSADMVDKPEHIFSHLAPNGGTTLT